MKFLENIYLRINHHIKTGIIIGSCSSSPNWSTLPSPARHWLQEGKGIWGGYAVLDSYFASREAGRAHQPWAEEQGFVKLD